MVAGFVGERASRRFWQNDPSKRFGSTTGSTTAILVAMPKKRRTAQRPVSSDPKIRQIVDVVERLRGDDFERLGNDPLMWFACADGLLRAAEAVMCAALRQPGCLILPALMLRGFALEDLDRKSVV